MKSLILILSFLSSNTFAGTYQCHSFFGDGVDAEIKVTIGEETISRPSYVTEKNLETPFRLVKIENMDRAPKSRNLIAIGGLDSQNVHLALMNDKGVNVGTINTPPKPASMNPKNVSMFLSIYGVTGDWIDCHE